MKIFRSRVVVQLALWSLLIAGSFACLVRFTAPGFTVRIQPINATSSPAPVWVMDIASAGDPKTNWDAIELGAGWRKAPDATLPSGAAAIADSAAAPLLYPSRGNQAEIAFGQGPGFGQVAISNGITTTTLDLAAAQQGIRKYEIDRPWFYRLRTASAGDWLRTARNTLVLWFGLMLLGAVVARPQRLARMVSAFRGKPATTTAARPVAEQPLVALPDQRQDIAIAVRGVGKMYRIYDQPLDRLKQMVRRGTRPYGREFWALRGVSFTVRRGETMGIIGRNGSGKSTLLQMIAGTLTPTEGSIQVQGRVAALLELGSGFNPEFTGRENIFLNGAVLGLSREDMEQRLDAILAFADIGAFVDQPVKTYSSGMMVRLAFAVQASIEPDILIVDEALAVGDVFFQQKCYRHLEKLRERGTAILLVSHGMGDIKQYCQHALLLKAGETVFLGDSADAVAQYLLFEHGQERLSSSSYRDTSQVGEEANDPSFGWPAADAFLPIDHLPQVSNGMARCTAVAVCDNQGNPCHIFQQGETASFFYEFEILQPIEAPLCGIEIHNDKGITVHGKNSLQYDPEDPVPPAVPSGARVRCRQDVTLAIAVGEYTYEVGMGMIAYEDYQQRGQYATTALYPRIMRICHMNRVNRLVVVERAASEQTAHQSRLMHWGLADLPGSCRLQAFIPADPLLTHDM